MLVLATAFAFSVKAQEVFDPVQWTFTVNELNDGEFELVATATIEPSYHIYSTNMPDMAPLPTVFSFEPTEYYEPVGEGYDLTEVPLFHDDIFEVDYHQFSGTASFGQKFKRLKDGPIQLVGEVNYQACKDGMCVSLTEDVNMAVLTADDENEGVGGHARSNIWAMILEAILWGFAALLTPCVFPMIPMTVSFFMHGEGESKSLGRFKAFMYFGYGRRWARRRSHPQRHALSAVHWCDSDRSSLRCR